MNSDTIATGLNTGFIFAGFLAIAGLLLFLLINKKGK